jgi:hypothetical protein
VLPTEERLSFVERFPVAEPPVALEFVLPPLMVPVVVLVAVCVVWARLSKLGLMVLPLALEALLTPDCDEVVRVFAALLGVLTSPRKRLEQLVVPVGHGGCDWAETPVAIASPQAASRAALTQSVRVREVPQRFEIIFAFIEAPLSVCKCEAGESMLANC